MMMILVAVLLQTTSLMSLLEPSLMFTLLDLPLVSCCLKSSRYRMHRSSEWLTNACRPFYSRRDCAVTASKRDIRDEYSKSSRHILWRQLSSWEDRVAMRNHSVAIFGTKNTAYDTEWRNDRCDALAIRWGVFRGTVTDEESMHPSTRLFNIC